MNLTQLKLFLTIVEKGSMAAAARELGLSPATVSERLAALESHYGVTLLNRTTRALGLTEEGRTLFDGARSVLEEAQDLENRVRCSAETLSGRVRIAAPLDLGRATVVPVVDAFLSEHPAVSVELLLSDGYLNVIDEGIDIAVRFGSLPDSTLRVRNLGEFRRLVCAAPSYVEKYGVLGTPADLESHNCIVMRWGVHIENVWHFRAGREQLQVRVRGDRVTNDSRLVREWAVAGHGIVSKSELDVRGDINAGRLVCLLEDYVMPLYPAQIVFPPGRTLPRRVRALADKLAGAIQGTDGQ